MLVVGLWEETDILFPIDSTLLIMHRLLLLSDDGRGSRRFAVLHCLGVQRGRFEPVGVELVC